MAEIYNFFGDIFDYLRETYWEADFGVYESFEIRLPGMTMGQFIALLMAGLFLAGLVAFYERRYLGQFIRALLREDCADEASAKSLGELGLVGRRLLCFHLRAPDTPLRKLTACTGGVAAENTENPKNEPPRVSQTIENGEGNGEDGRETCTGAQENATTAAGEEPAQARPPLPRRMGREELLATRFYIPPDLRTRAELRYRARGNTVGALCVMALACIFGGIAFVHLTPLVLGLADKIFVALGV